MEDDDLIAPEDFHFGEHFEQPEPQPPVEEIPLPQASAPEELPEEPACFKVCRMAEAEAFFKRISVS